MDKKEIISYRIGVRKYSSNVILGSYNATTKEGKTIIKEDIVLMSGLNKSDGDEFINKVFKLLYN